MQFFKFLQTNIISTSPNPSQGGEHRTAKLFCILEYVLISTKLFNLEITIYQKKKSCLHKAIPSKNYLPFPFSFGEGVRRTDEV